MIKVLDPSLHTWEGVKGVSMYLLIENPVLLC